MVELTKTHVNILLGMLLGTGLKRTARMYGGEPVVEVLVTVLVFGSLLVLVAAFKDGEVSG